MRGTKKVLTSKRGVQRHEKNPFLKDAIENSKTGTRKIANKTGDRFMIISEQTGELIAPAGFHEIIEVDKTQFVKLYINGVKAFQGLKSAGAKVFEIIYRAVQKCPGQDKIWLHFMEIEQNISPISEATFYRGMRELIDKGFIAESTTPGAYFLNIDYLFNGNRLAFIKEYRITSQKRAIENCKDEMTPKQLEVLEQQ